MRTVACLFLSLCAGSQAMYTGPTTQAAINLMKSSEKFSATFYNDAVGIKTIGYGHACHVWNCSVPLNGKYNVPLTQADGDALFAEDVAVYEKCVAKLVTYSNLTENQFSALVSLTFNIGCGSIKKRKGLAGSTLLRKLNTGDVAGAADQFKAWVHGSCGGKRCIPPGLVTRREAERQLFCTGNVCEALCLGKFETQMWLYEFPNISAPAVELVPANTLISVTGRINGESYLSKDHELQKIKKSFRPFFHLTGTDLEEWIQVLSNKTNSTVYTHSKDLYIEVGNGQPWCIANMAKYNGTTNQDGIDLMRRYNSVFHPDIVTAAEECVSHSVTYANLNENQFSALVSLMYNVDCDRFKSSKLLRKLNGGDVRGAADQIPKWIQVMSILFRHNQEQRRAHERDLFCMSNVCGDAAARCMGISTTDQSVTTVPVMFAPGAARIDAFTPFNIVGRTKGQSPSIDMVEVISSDGCQKMYVWDQDVYIVENNRVQYCHDLWKRQ